MERTCKCWHQKLNKIVRVEAMPMLAAITDKIQWAFAATFSCTEWSVSYIRILTKNHAMATTLFVGQPSERICLIHGRYKVHRDFPLHLSLFLFSSAWVHCFFLMLNHSSFSVDTGSSSETDDNLNIHNKWALLKYCLINILSHIS